MQFSITLLALAASFATALPSAESAAPAEHPIQKRGCYSGGETWGGEKGNAYGKISEVCNNNFQGNYGRNEIRYQCRNLSSNKKIDMTLQYIGSGSRSIGRAECESGLNSEVNNCNNGGSTSYANWKYSADPNAGQC
ncbi:hypothetical protein QBC39DRAFT_377615 [Podospora conica]|nr:hypothetical protein QBC39DRAFT_377615 [Schizothecium conicum]